MGKVSRKLLFGGFPYGKVHEYREVSRLEGVFGKNISELESLVKRYLTLKNEERGVNGGRSMLDSTTCVGVRAPAYLLRQLAPGDLETWSVISCDW